MATDSELTRRKHHRSSSPDVHSRRRKHRHHRDHHHRHRSKKDNVEVTNAELEVGRIEIDEIENRKLGNSEDESGAIGDVVVSNGFQFTGVAYEMEEGEIVEEDDLSRYVNGEFETSKKKLDSDMESGEIKNLQDNGSNLEVSSVNAKDVEKKSRKLDNDDEGNEVYTDLDKDKASRLGGRAYRNYSHKNHEDVHMVLSVDGKSIRKLDDMVYPTDERISSSSEKKHRVVSSSHTHEAYLNGSSPINLSKSPVRTRERSRSRSILREPSPVDNTFLAEVNSRSNPGNERVIAPDRNNSDSSRDGMRSKDTKHHSSRYSEGTDRFYNRDGRDKHRKGSRDSVKDRDRARENEREKDREWNRERERERERERARNRDRSRVDKESEGERDRDREGERKGEGRNKDTDGVRTTDRDGGRPRSRDADRDKESDRFRRRHMYDDDVSFRDRNDDSRHRRSIEDHARERSRKSDFENTRTNSNSGKMDGENIKREEDIQGDYQDKIVMQLAEQEEDDLERIKEESKRRKQAILEKYKKKSMQKNELNAEERVEKQDGQSSEHVASAEVAADSIDNQMEGSEIFVPESNFAVGKSPLQNGLSVIQRSVGIGTGGLGDGSPKSERPADMFCDDIFGESPAVRKMGKADNAAVEKSELHDNWDDAEGYYGYRFGEILDGRYEIIAAHGRGVFSSVVRAKDLKAKSSDPEEVAIKIIRNNETMYKAGMEEFSILKKLVKVDPDDKRHCVRFLSTFKYRNHLCLVFESLQMNLREVLKKFGRNIGLKLTAVRTYAKQLFIALKHLKNCSVLHCDIKPDNMLVNEAKNILKLCDFGNAMFAGKNEITPYLVSRFYRAPEIILGLPYDHPMDIWSVGCCLFELYTGKVLFPGSTNNDMLRLHMELKGPFPKRMLRKGAFAEQHFDQDLNFLATEEDPVTKKGIRRLIANVKPKDFGALLLGSPGEDPKMLANFKDLMEKIFVVDPDKRLSVSQALSHPFITGK